VIVPFTSSAPALAREAMGVYDRVQSGELNPALYFHRIFDALPDGRWRCSDRFGWPTSIRCSVGSLRGWHRRPSSSHRVHWHRAVHLHVRRRPVHHRLHRLLPHPRRRLADACRAARDPLSPEQGRNCSANSPPCSAPPSRATCWWRHPGCAGGIAFCSWAVGAALLCGVLMAFLSLLPAVGAALVWFRWRPISSSSVRLEERRAIRLRRASDRTRRQPAAPDPGRQGYAHARLRGHDHDARRMAVFGINGFVLGRRSRPCSSRSGTSTSSRDPTRRRRSSRAGGVDLRLGAATHSQ